MGGSHSKGVTRNKMSWQLDKDALLTKIDSSELKEPDWLHIACRNGWLDVYTLLVEKYGLNPWSVDAIHGALPLHFACTSGNIELVQYLISQYYDALSHVCDDGLTILHCAVMGGLAIVKWLVEEHGLKPMLNVDTPGIMFFAYNNWDDELMKYLIVDQGCSIVINDSTGYTLLHTACKDGAFNRFKFLVKECCCNPLVTTKNNETILHSLLFCPKVDLDFLSCIMYITYHAINPFTFDSCGRTAVYYAIMSMHPIKVLQHLFRCCKLNPADRAYVLSIAYHHWSDDLIKYLIQYKNCGFVTNCKTGNTILHNACRDMDNSKLRFLVEVCHLLIKHVVNHHFDTLIHAFSSSAWQPINFDVLSYLCDKGCNPFQRNYSNYIPLECAIIHGHEHNAVSIVSYFVQHFEHNTQVLSLIYQHWNDEMIKYLIVKVGYDKMIIDRQNGDTVLHRVCRDNNLTRFKFLVQECKCDPNICNGKEKTLLHTVCMSEKSDLYILSFVFKLLVPSGVMQLDYSAAFNCAVKNKRLDFVKYFVEQQNEFLNGINTCTVICSAFKFWNEAIIKYLILEAKFNIITNTVTGNTLLHKACWKSNCAKLQFLIKDCHCDPIVTNKYGETLLDIVTPANDEIIYFLCNECELTPVEGLKAIKLIIDMQKESKETISMIRFISKCGCDITNNIDIMNSACVNWNYKTVKFLIVEVGCNIITDKHTGNTLLHKVCSESNCTKLQFLIRDCHCDPLVTNKYGKTLLDILTPANDDIIYFLCNECELTPFEGLKAIKLIIDMQKNSQETISMIHFISKCGCDITNNVDIMNSACVNWNYKTVKFLIVEVGCNIITDKHTGNTLLHKVCSESNCTKLQFLIRDCHCDPLVTNDYGETLLDILTPANDEIIYFLCNECELTPVEGLKAIKLIIDMQKESQETISMICYMISKYGWELLVTKRNKDTLLDILTPANDEIIYFLCNECELTPVEGLKAIKLIIDMQKESKETISMIRFISKCGCDITNNIDIMNSACVNWNYKTVKFLIVEVGCNIITDKHTGNTLLHKVCSESNCTKLQFLIRDCHCDPLVTNKYGKTLLDILTPANDDIIYFLCNECELTPFEGLKAIKLIIDMQKESQETISMIRYMISKCGCDRHINNVDIMNSACVNWNYETVKFLIVDVGCNIIVDNDTGDTILHKVCIIGTKNMLKFLVNECNCSPHVVNKRGESLLHTACRYAYDLHSCFFDLLRYLCLECGCSLTHDDFSNAFKIKLITEMQKESKETVSMIRYMISKFGWDITNNADIMNSACINWNYDTVKYLIVEVGCNIIVDNDTGDTILHKVCIIGTIEMLEFLVTECNCSPYVVNKKGDSLLHTACKYVSDGSLHLFQILRFLCVECDCSPALTYDDVSTAFTCAIQYEEGFSLVQHLVENYRDSMSIVTDHNLFFLLSSSHWNQSILYYLIVEKGFIVVDTSTGDTLLHKACETANLEKFYFLLQKCECDPFVVNNIGESIFHILFMSAQSFSDAHLEMLAYLCEQYTFDCNRVDIKSRTVFLTVCGILRPENCVSCVNVMQTFAKNIKSDDIYNEDGSTILHQLCSKCHYGPEVVKLIFDLIKIHKCDPLTEDYYRNTILHCILSKRKCSSPHLLSLIYFLIDECGIDISSVNVHGSTLLHLACQHFTGDISVIEHILSTGKADPLLSNKRRKTPLMLLNYSCCTLTDDDRDRVFQLISRFGEVKLTHPIHSFVNIVLLGDPGVGKSTLIKAIKDRNDVNFIRNFNARIVLHIFNDDDLGNIIIHDLAGHVEYYSSHIAVLENLLQGSAAVFIIVISLDDENFLKSFYRWLTIVENVSHNSSCKCQLILAVSHIDQHLRTKVSSIESLKQEFSQCLSDNDVLYGHGVFGLSRRYRNNLSSLISALSTACQSISEANTRETSLYCHMLYHYFQCNHSEQTFVYTLEDIVHKAEESNELLLPQDIHQLHRIVCTLSSTGLIVFLESQSCLEQSWIIADKSVLVHDLNGVLFAPTTFKQHANIASNTGVVKLSDLLSLLPQYNPELLLRFLQYSELCQIISKDFMTLTNMKPLSQEVVEEADTYLFVPALIKETGIPEIKEPFKFGWCLRCGKLKKHHFFTPRFLHLLLLHLAYKFSESSPNAFEQLCQIWNKGIFWKDFNGAQTLIELIDNNQSLIVLVSFQDRHETSVARIINHIREVIVEILTCKQKVMPRTDTTEFILDNSNLSYPLGPLSDLTLFDMRLIAMCLVKGDSFIPDTTGDRQVAVIKLFFSDKLSIVRSCCEAVFGGREPMVRSVL